MEKGLPQPATSGCQMAGIAPIRMTLRTGGRRVVGRATSGAFIRAANVVYETSEGRKVWKLKPLQLLMTLIGILFAAVIVAAVVLSGPVVEAVGRAMGLGDTALTVWNLAK